jgi:hypothetical protein
VPLELQERVLVLVEELYGGERRASPSWLNRPAAEDAGKRWRLVRAIYRKLTDMELPSEMPPRERRSVDAVLQRFGEPPRIVEVDEKQHFNRYRATTIRCYPSDLEVAFDKGTWLEACDRKRRLEGGGFGKPKPPLFPHADGRHRQRAFRDALCDLLPSAHGWLPTLRIADFEIADWIWSDAAFERMERLLSERLTGRQR